MQKLDENIKHNNEIPKYEKKYIVKLLATIVLAYLSGSVESTSKSCEVVSNCGEFAVQESSSQL